MAILAGLGIIAILAILWAGPVANEFGAVAGGLWMPSDDSFQVLPQYSVAEARVHEGNYEAAIATYRKYMELYPNEVTPHLRIADLQLTSFNKPEAAIEELKQGAAKAKTAESFGLIHFRLAELYLKYGARTQEALHSFQEIQRCHPGTRQAAAALVRAQNLLKLQDQQGA